MRKAITLLFLVLLLAVLVPGYAPAQGGFNIKIVPSKLEITGDRGSAQQFLINVQNLGPENQVLHVYFNDYYIKADNQFVFQKPGHYSYSCAKWLSTDTDSLEAPAGQTVQKAFTLSVPPKAEPGGHYGIIFFEQVPTKQTKVSTVPRIGVVTLVTVPGRIVRKGIIRSVEVTNSWFWPTKEIVFLAEQKIHARVTFYNAGNVHLTVKGKLTYTPSFGWSTGSVDLPEITVLPKTTRYLDADIKDPPFIGTYEATATVMYGPSLDVFDTTLTKKTTFHIYPLSLLVLLLLLLAIIFVPIWLYRRSRYEWVYPEDIEGGAEPTEPGPAPAEAEAEPNTEAPVSATVAGAAVAAAAPPAEPGVVPGQAETAAAVAATPEAPQAPGVQPAAGAKAQGQVPPGTPVTPSMQPPVTGAPTPPVAPGPPAGPHPGTAPPAAKPGPQPAAGPSKAEGPSPAPQGGPAPGAQPAQQPPPTKTAPPPKQPPIAQAPPDTPETDGS
jgi:hypothetical protein